MRSLVAVAVAVLSAGCLSEGPPDARDLGCGTRHILTLVEGPPPVDALLLPTNGTDPPLGFVNGFIAMADYLHGLGPEEPNPWQAHGHHSLSENATEFRLTPLEWFGLIEFLDDQAVVQGGSSLGAIDDYGSYRFFVVAADRTFLLDFGVMQC